MKKIQEKFVTAALRLSDIFTLSFYRFIKYLHNFERYSSGNNELKRLCKMSKSTLYPLQSLAIIY